MKRLIILLTIITAVLLVGCATNDIYATGKKVYIRGEAVVKANADSLNPQTLKDLRKVNEAAQTYDATRTMLKGE